MRKVSLLFVIIACLFIPAHVHGQSPFDALNSMDKAINSADDEFTLVDAYYLGRAVAANILASYRPYTRSPQMTQYLNRICQTLVINSSGAPAFNGYSVMILDSNEFNAFATPGGHIFVTRRLIESATSEDMLAAVLAHELAHIMLNHSVNIINEMKLSDELNTVASRAATTAARNSADSKRAAYFRASISTTVDTLMKNGYSQSQEFEADREAMSLLARAGYSPAALLDMLRLLQQVQGSQRGGFYSTHPLPALRIANVEKLQFRVTDTRQFRVPRFRNVKL